jgi:hypothetical protein
MKNVRIDEFFPQGFTLLHFLFHPVGEPFPPCILFL